MDNYELICHIGKGSFGVVSKVRRKSDSRVLVWKELDYGKMSEKEKQQLVCEVNILRELNHPNIVQYCDRIVDKKATKIYIIMEYCEGGDMKTLLRNCKKNRDFIAEDVIWKIFTQLLLALNECHTKKSGKVLHRDLKPANLFLDDQNNIKLGDFGLSRMMGDQSVFAYTYVGTPYYMSPEQVNESHYNEKSDIWSAGCLLYEIASLRPPFEASNHLSLAIKIKAGRFDRIPLRYSEDLQKTIEVMLNIDPNARPTAEQLLTIPQVAMRVQEKRLKDKSSHVKQREKDIRKKEEELKEFEANLEKKQKELKELEQRVNEKKQYLLEYEEPSQRNNGSVRGSLVGNSSGVKGMGNGERKQSGWRGIDKENDHIYQGNRDSARLEAMRQDYKSLKAIGRKCSGEFSSFSHFNGRMFQEAPTNYHK